MADDQTSFFSKKKSQVLAAKITIIWFCLFSLNSLTSCIQVGVAGKYWSQMSAEDRFAMCLAILTNWTGMIMAFLFSAGKRVAHGENPLFGASEPATVTTTTETVVTPPTDK